MSVISFLGLCLEVNLQVLHNALALQIPDLDTVLCRRTEPVPIGAEAQSVDDRPGIKRVQPLPLRKIPQENHAILPSTCAQRPVRRHGNSVHVPTVAAQRAPELAVREVPHLHTKSNNSVQWIQKL